MSKEAISVFFLLSHELDSLTLFVANQLASGRLAASREMSDRASS